MKVVGITGTIGCGKELVKEILSRNFANYSVSLSSAIRWEMEKRKGSVSRGTLQDMGNELRQKYGTHVLAKVAVEYLQRNRPLIIVDGIRNPGEAEYLKKTFGDNFKLIAVDAPQQLRFERVKNRARAGDPADFDAFVQMDDRDQGKDEPPYGQHVKTCIDMADFKVENSGTPDELAAKMQEVIKQLAIQ
jgi:dephospho-CoA kinase